jgi:hypothetical protein
VSSEDVCGRGREKKKALAGPFINTHFLPALNYTTGMTRRHSTYQGYGIHTWSVFFSFTVIIVNAINSREREQESW